MEIKEIVEPSQEPVLGGPSRNFDIGGSELSVDYPKDRKVELEPVQIGQRTPSIHQETSTINSQAINDSDFSGTTYNGEFPIFNIQGLREKVAFSGSDSPIKALCVALGSRRCLEVIENKEKLEVKRGAHKLFDKLSEPILLTKMTSGDILGNPRTKELEELDFGSLIFDPGGEKHKRKPNDCDGILIHENGMVSNACKVLSEVLESANEGVTKPDELLPQCESYTPLVFDPGGAYVWFRICHQMLPVHWEPGGCFQIVRGLVGNLICEQRGGVILSSHFTRACMRMMTFDRGRAGGARVLYCWWAIYGSLASLNRLLV